MVKEKWQNFFDQTSKNEVVLLVPPPLAVLVLERASPWLGVAEALPLTIKQAGRRAPGDVNLEGHTGLKPSLSDSKKKSNVKDFTSQHLYLPPLKPLTKVHNVHKVNKVHCTCTCPPRR